MYTRSLDRPLAIVTLLAGLMFLLPASTWADGGAPLDAAAARPVQVKDINYGEGHSDPFRLTNVSGLLYFGATDGSHGLEPWKSDGTELGTYMVKDIVPGAGSSLKLLQHYPRSAAGLNRMFFFVVVDGSGEHQLWRSGGSEASTQLLRADMDAWIMTVSGGGLFFRPRFTNAGELWKSYGTPASTIMLKDTLYEIGGMADVNGTLYFNSWGGLWKSDGTEAGTEIVKLGIEPTSLTNVDGTLFFASRELWKSDGTEAGTVLVKDINPTSGSDPYYLTNVNGTLFFRANDGSQDTWLEGNELWKSDGTAGGTVLVKNINPTGDSQIKNLTNVGGTLFFNAYDGTNGNELWKSDGTKAGTVMVKNIHPNGPSWPDFLTDVNGTLFFVADDGTHGRELWKSDGTAAGTVMVHDLLFGSYGSEPSSLVNLNGTLMFNATDGESGHELWKLEHAPPQQPKVTHISVVGRGATKGEPTTGHPVEIRPSIVLPAGFQVTGCSWSGDLPRGNGDPAKDCRYTYTPATGAGPALDTYGEKHVTLAISYRDTRAGTAGEVYKNHTYKVFFPKHGDDDMDCALSKLTPWFACEPNWFEYWGDDGAVRQLARSDVIYNPTKGPNSWGSYDPGSDKIELGGAAAEIHYVGGISVPAVAGKCPGGEFGDRAGRWVRGIDCTAEVIEHEARHKWVTHNWDKDAAWDGKLDSDQGVPTIFHDDDLPDEFETSTTKTATDTVDSCSLAGIKGGNYAFYGDHEFYVMTYSDGKKGVATKDWANPGKQTSTAFTSYLLEPRQAEFASRSGLANPEDMHRPSSSAPQTGLGSLTGTYAEAGVDVDLDGAYDSLRLSVGLLIAETEIYNVVAWLEDSAETGGLWASSQGTLDPGSHVVDLVFDGSLINKSALDGPYDITRVELRVSDRELLEDAADDAHTTAAYSHTDFDPPAVAFAGIFSDTGIDTGADGLHDLLRVRLDLDVDQAGTYTITGELKDASSFAIASTSTLLTTGTQMVNLDFDGRLIFQNRQDGPYDLKALRVEDASWHRIDALYDAYSTVGYSYLEFQHGGTILDAASFGDQAVDTDGDGVYEFLRLEFQIDADPEGPYTILAHLDGGEGDLIDSVVEDVYLLPGANTIVLDFAGDAIYAHGVDGPYGLTSVALLDVTGNIVDGLSLAHTTQAYSYRDFGRGQIYLPLVVKIYTSMR